ncbi:unnamed protein product [Chrysoparadoxa australica]
MSKMPNVTDSLFGGKSVIYPQVGQLRRLQYDTGLALQLADCTKVQMGMEMLTRCHHITSNLTKGKVKGAPASTSYRVRVCKTCCGQPQHIELGTYMDQESAILVNDAHELMAGRYKRLIMLRPEDQPYLVLLRCVRIHKGKVRTQKVLDAIQERLTENKAVADRGTTRTVSPATTAASASPSPSPALPVAGAAQGQKRGAPGASPAGGLEHGGKEVNRTDMRAQDVVNRMYELMENEFVFSFCVSCGMADNIHQARESFQRVLNRSIAICRASHKARASPALLEEQEEEAALNSEEKQYAAAVAAVLAAYAPAEAVYLGQLVREVESKYLDEAGWGEMGKHFFHDLLLIDRAVHGPQRYTQAVQQVLSFVRDTIKRCQINIWRSLYKAKFPTWVSLEDALNGPFGAEGPSLMTQDSIINQVSRKHLVLFKVYQYLENVQRVSKENPKDADLASMVREARIPQLRKELQGTLSILWLQLATLCERQFDTFRDVDTIDQAFNLLDRIRPFLPERPLFEKFLICLAEVHMRVSLARYRQAGGEDIDFLMFSAQHHLQTLISVSQEMGLLPLLSTDPAVELVADDGVARAANQDYLGLEYLTILYSTLFEYFVVSGNPGVWYNGFTCGTALTALASVLEQLHKLHEDKGMTFLLAFNNRALGIVMQLCRSVVQKAPDHAGFLMKVAGLAHSLLVKNSQRFRYAQKIESNTASVVAFFVDLSLATRDAEGQGVEEEAAAQTLTASVSKMIEVEPTPLQAQGVDLMAQPTGIQGGEAPMAQSQQTEPPRPTREI